MKKVSILVPVYNEEILLQLLYNNLCEIINHIPCYKWEILFIDDGSRDNSLQLIKKFHSDDVRVSYVALSRNFGKEAAMMAGFDFVVGDCMIIMDADLQDPPSLIPDMLKLWEEGYEDVYARRNSRGKESWLRKRVSLLFYSILQKTTRIDILENTGDFRLLDKKCIRVLRTIRENERYTKGLFAWIGFSKKEVVFDRQDRVAGRSKQNFKNLLNLAVDGIMCFTIAPLRLSTLAGLLSSLGAFIYMFYFFFKAIIYGDPIQGFPTLIIAILFLGGLQLLCLGIIGEYLGHIFNETKHRPIYIAQEYNGEEI